MGGKQVRSGKYVYLLTAVLISLFMTGCTLMSHKKPDVEEAAAVRTPEEDAGTHLTVGRQLFAEGEYDEALKEEERAASLANGGPVAEEALLYTGLIYAHPSNPKRDYGKSAAYFKKLVKNHPKSPLVEQAKIMIAILRENEELGRTIEKLSAIIEAWKKVDIGIEGKKREKAR